jgi:DNA replication protein DnaC
MIEPTQTLETLRCVDCRQPFAGQVLHFAIPGLNYTSVIRPHRCPACQIGFEQQRAAEARAQRQCQREAAWAQICPVEFRLQSESGGATDLTRLKAEAPQLDKVLAWAETNREMGLLLRGPSGTCKTRVMWRLLRKLWEEGVRFRAVTSLSLEAEYQEARQSNGLTAWRNALIAVPVLFLDDLGKMRWLPSTEVSVFDGLEARTSMHRPLLITTEDSGETLASRLSGHVAAAFIRRLRDYCTCIEFGS